MTNQRFILFGFSEFATEDRASRSLQSLVLSHLRKDVHYGLVIHHRRLEDRFNDRFIGEDDVAGE